jgi:hypothetical protein
MVTNKQYEEALARGRAEFALRASSARVTQRRLRVEFTNGVSMSVPVELVEGLADATAAQLARVEVEGGGTSLHWDELDVDLFVPALVQGVTGTESWMARIGRSGGQARTQRKAAAARKNGLKGGRPRRSDAARAKR